MSRRQQSVQLGGKPFELALGFDFGQRYGCWIDGPFENRVQIGFTQPAVHGIDPNATFSSSEVDQFLRYDFVNQVARVFLFVLLIFLLFL